MVSLRLRYFQNGFAEVIWIDLVSGEARLQEWLTFLTLQEAAAIILVRTKTSFVGSSLESNSEKCSGVLVVLIIQNLDFICSYGM
jgi:hypothetical protein